jgi:hypothetical protein
MVYIVLASLRLAVDASPALVPHRAMYREVLENVTRNACFRQARRNWSGAAILQTICAMQLRDLDPPRADALTGITTRAVARGATSAAAPAGVLLARGGAPPDTLAQPSAPTPRPLPRPAELQVAPRGPRLTTDSMDSAFGSEGDDPMHTDRL